jgi:Glucosamine 6-phosphate synthetase, contains amidotransferase and phosphosugar isomerase domains
MVSLLDCIERVPQVLETILETRHENMAALFSALEGKLDTLDEIILVGSGTSNTSAITSKIFVEKVTGVRTSAVYPNDFCYNTHYYSPNALYVFTSQTGNSIVARQAQQLMQEKGYLTVSITESADTPIAKESQVHIDMCCGKEEYPTRTIGYCASVFTHMIMGLEIGLRRGHISQTEYDHYLAAAARVPDSHRTITPRAMTWLDTHRRQLMRSRCVVFTGADALQGVALEAAVKVWEIPQHISIGYELEEGLHGANYGYNYHHCVVVLNHGGRENQKALGLARWMKDVYKNGIVIGSNVLDESDFPINLVGGDFDVLEFAPVVQIIAYRMALEEGRDLFAPHDNRVMESYFKTHDDKHES